MGHPNLAHLREGNRRLTPQRRLVWEILHHSSDHLTAEQLHTEAKAQLPDLSQPTVYRILTALVDAHHVREIAIPHGPSRYETICADDPHSDLVCNRCGRIEKVHDEVLVRTARSAMAGHDFQPDELHLVLYGTCGCCTTATSG